MATSPGWFPDPDGKPCSRYWDGSSWTEQTRPLMKEFVHRETRRLGEAEIVLLTAIAVLFLIVMLA